MESQETNQNFLVNKTSSKNEGLCYQIAFDFYGNFVGYKLPSSNDIVD